MLETIEESRKKTPETFILAIVYSFGRVASRHAIRSGSTEVGLGIVSTTCAFAPRMEVKATVSSKLTLIKILCIWLINSVNIAGPGLRKPAWMAVKGGKLTVKN